MQIVQGFVSGISAGPYPTEQWQQVNINVVESSEASVESTAVLSPSAFVNNEGSLFFQLMPNRYLEKYERQFETIRVSSALQTHCLHQIRTSHTKNYLPR